jgi:hypothetical protein
VKYLIDTNILLEILLEILLGQTRAREAKEFLIRVADELIFSNGARIRC